MSSSRTPHAPTPVVRSNAATAMRTTSPRAERWGSGGAESTIRGVVYPARRLGRPRETPTSAMEHPGLLRDLVVVMGACLLAVVVLGRLRIPTLVGFLVAGLLIGPGGFRLVVERSNIEQLAEVGVVFLLFTIGLQFSVSDLLGLKRYVLIGGGLQVGITTVLVSGLALAFGQP